MTHHLILMLARLSPKQGVHPLHIGKMLASDAGQPETDPTAHLLATIIMNTWRVAYTEALFRQKMNIEQTDIEFLFGITPRGFCAAEAAAKGTQYL